MDHPLKSSGHNALSHVFARMIELSRTAAGADAGGAA